MESVETFRIGELARRVGATPRAVRYYEELGLLPGRDRSDGAHRVYDSRDEDRLRDLLRVRELLGLSLVGAARVDGRRGCAGAAARTLE